MWDGYYVARLRGAETRGYLLQPRVWHRKNYNSTRPTIDDLSAAERTAWHREGACVLVNLKVWPLRRDCGTAVAIWCAEKRVHMLGYCVPMRMGSPEAIERSFGAVQWPLIVALWLLSKVS